jgi:hypothetical protein
MLNIAGLNRLVGFGDEAKRLLALGDVRGLLKSSGLAGKNTLHGILMSKLNNSIGQLSGVMVTNQKTEVKSAVPLTAVLNLEPETTLKWAASVVKGTQLPANGMLVLGNKQRVPLNALFQTSKIGFLPVKETAEVVASNGTKLQLKLNQTTKLVEVLDVDTRKVIAKKAPNIFAHGMFDEDHLQAATRVGVQMAKEQELVLVPMQLFPSNAFINLFKAKA